MSGIIRERVLVAGQSLATALGFKAQSVRVDNPTAQYVHLIDTNIYVAPGAYGAIYNLSAGDPQMAQAEWAAPPGTAQPAAVALQQAVLTYYEDWLPPAAGIVVAVTAAVAGSVAISNSPNVAVDNKRGASMINSQGGEASEVVIATSVGSGTNPYSVPIGTVAMHFLIQRPDLVTQLTVTGNSSNTNYLNYLGMGGDGGLPRDIYLVPIAWTVDRVVTVTFTASILSALSIVALTDPAAWISPGASAVSGSAPVVVNAGNNITILPLPGLNRYWLHEFVLALSAAPPPGLILIEGSVGGPKTLWTDSGAAKLAFSFRGERLQQQASLLLQNNTGGAVTVNGYTLTYGMST